METSKNGSKTPSNNVKNVKNIGRTNKRKGSNAEREYAQKFRELGFSFCKTSRQASRLYDDSKIDLMFIPFNVQVKAGKQRGINYSKVLEELSEAIKVNFPPTHEVHGLPKVCIHRKDGTPGKASNEFSELVVLTFEDFKNILKTNFDEIVKIKKHDNL